MNTLIKFSQAQIIGRGHILAGRNSQDALYTGNLEVGGEKVYFGIICDGCSEGKNSEVGAKLASTYIGRQVEILVKSKVDIKKIPDILHKRVQDFLKQLLGKISFDSPESRVNYIKDNLLFTILGFIYTPSEVLIFNQGDGVIIVNDEVYVLDEQDMPRYIGYSLVERKFLSPDASEPPESFDIIVRRADSVSKMAVASDSLANELEVVPRIWINEKEISLQKKVNVWSLVEHKFKDDLTLVVLEKFDSLQD